MAINNLLRQTVTIATFNAYDAYGQASYYTAADVAARVEDKETRVLMGSGEITVSTCRTYVPASTPVDTSSKIIMPDSTAPIIIKVGTAVDGQGNTTYKVIYT